jgi:arylformamidase
LSDHARGDEWTTTHLSFSAHTGTHVDAPSHRLRGGATLDTLDLHALIGRAYVVDLQNVESEISAEALAARNIPQDARRLIFKTANNALWMRAGFNTRYVGLSRSGALWLVERGMRLVAFDYLSADVYQTQNFPAHDILLGAGIVIVESVMTGDVVQGWYSLICLPLRVSGAEGAPARAVLLSGTNWFEFDNEEER